MNRIQAIPPDDLMRHVAALRRLARSLLIDHSQADDLVQDAFLAALETPPQQRRSLTAWLGRVVRNRAHDMRRTDQRRVAREQAVAATRTPGPEAGTAARLDAEAALLDALRSLDEPYRTAVVLRYYEDLPPRSIAEHLGVSVKTVKTRLARALVMLRQRLDRSRGSYVAALVPLAESPASLGVLGAKALEGFMLMNIKKIAVTLCLLLVVIGAWPGIFWSLGSDPAHAVTPVVETRDGVDRSPTEDGGSRIAVREHEQPIDQGATEEEAAGMFGSLIVRARWERDGSHAAGVGIIVHPENDPAMGRSIVRVDADTEGVVRLGRVHAGRVVVRSDFGGEVAFALEPGEAEEIEFEIPSGVPVVGTVVSAKGQPISGAGIWLTTGGSDWLGGRIVTTTGPDGSFTLPGVDKRQSLGACAAGYAPSALVDLEQVDTDVRPVEIRLQLRTGGCDVVGRVVDEQGVVVPGALVAIGSAAAASLRLADETREEAWTPRVVNTDDAGRFRAQGIPAGDVSVAVRAVGWPIWSGRQAGQVGGLITFDVVLAPAVTVAGVVSDEEGQPVSGARVVALPRPFAGLSVESGPRNYIRDAVFPLPTARTNTKGEYELAWLPPGSIHLYASRGPGPRGRPRGRFAGVAQTSLEVESGARVRWDAVLSLGRVIRGRVVRPDGKPLKFLWSIFARPEREVAGVRARFTTTNAAGEFQFPLLGAVPYTLELRDNRKGSVPTKALHVVPDGEEVVLTWKELPPEAPPRASLSGSVVDAGARLSGAKSLRIVLRTESGRFVPGSVEGSRFRVEDVPPGRCRVCVYSLEHLVHVSSWIELAPGEAKKLDALTTGPAGELLIRTRGVDPIDARGYLIGADGVSSYTLSRAGNGFRGSNLSPGKYRLRVHGKDAYGFGQAVEIVAGAESRAEVEFLPAVAKPLEMFIDDSIPKWRRLHIRIFDTGGRLCWKLDQGYLGGLFKPYRQRVTLPAGKYTFEAWFDDRAHQRHDFAVELGPGKPAPVRFELR